MTWSLEIHHIGLRTAGDATLLIAKDTPAPTAQMPNPAPTTIRSMLIDGGSGVMAASVNAYLQRENIASLDIMVVTHYDADHFNGLRSLLNRATFDPTYDHVLIFDQGEPGMISGHNGGPYDNGANTKPTGREDAYTSYLNNIRRKLSRRRITAVVSSNPTNVNGWRRPDWLIGKEILWSAATRFDANGNYDPDGTHDNMGQAIIINAQGSSWDANGDPLATNGNSLIPVGAPTVRCIAANQYVMGQANPIGGQGVDPRNEKSLIFLVKFGNFKYYIGGDAESAQEDALINVLNPTTNDAGRVHAMKLSHHGAATATSQNFVNGLRPKAAFISNGPNNQHGHPHQAPINHLEGRSVLVMNNAMPPAQVYPQGLQQYYLTGTSTAAILNMNLATIPAYPATQRAGLRHLTITVSTVQANNAADGHNTDNFTVHWRDLAFVQTNLLTFRIVPNAQQSNH